MNKFLQSAFIGISFVSSCLLPETSDAQYKIFGQLKNYDSLWINRITLSACDSTSHINLCSTELIINKDSLDKEGNFTLSGNNLPDENLVYRLDLNVHRTGVMNSWNNHIYFILNNHSTIEINCNNVSLSPFDYEIKGSPESASLQKFEKYLSGFQKLASDFYSKQGAAKIFAESRFNTNIRNYCDTCKNAIVALIGINEILDFGKDYAEHPDFYKRFLARIKESPESNSVYVKEFEERLNMIDNKNQAKSITGKYFSNPLVYIEGVLILLLLMFVIYLKGKLKRLNGIKHKPEQNKAELFETLTRREKEILVLLIEDSPNKDIANKLNLEVSTIKTHIGKIYQKLAISNRNEVKVFAQYLKNTEPNQV